MNLNEELWRNHQYGILASFIHHITYWRCFSLAYKDEGHDSEMWTYTTDAHLIRAVIGWCMVFGADSNEVHWKNVVLDTQLQDDFRNYLLDKLSMTNKQWVAYWSDMTTFRNKYAAHRVPEDQYPSLPKMESALQAVIEYDNWLRQMLSKLFIPIFDEPLLSDRYDRLMRTSILPITKMVKIAPSVKEEYEGNPPEEN